MSFCSTRDVGSKPPRRYTFEESITLGWAVDGGMLLPERIPDLSVSDLSQLRGQSYPQICVAVLRRFIDVSELSSESLECIVARSFARFGSTNVVEVRRVRVSDKQTVHVAELWHGPSLAFKDLGMSVLTNLLQHFLEQRKTKLNVLVGTSGDTGSSAIEAVAGLRNMNLIVLFPENRISRVQRLQMTVAAAGHANIAAWGVDGTSDDLDVPLANLFADDEFRRDHFLGSLNSVNIARILVQVVNFVFSFLAATADAAPELPSVVVCVPTGAAGNLAAGVIAKKMGLPIFLCAATNENNVFCRFVNEGILEKLETVTVTNSPSMDIQVPYNVERILALVLDSRAEAAALICTYYATGRLLLTPEQHSTMRAVGLSAAFATSMEVEATIARVWATSRYLLDPHSAVGVHVAATLAERVCCLMCAHPCKFPATVSRALAGGEAGDGGALLVDATHPHVGRVLRDLVARDGPYPVLPRTATWAADWERRVRDRILAWDAVA